MRAARYAAVHVTRVRPHSVPGRHEYLFYHLQGLFHAGGEPPATLAEGKIPLYAKVAEKRPMIHDLVQLAA